MTRALRPRKSDPGFPGQERRWLLRRLRSALLALGVLFALGFGVGCADSGDGGAAAWVGAAAADSRAADEAMARGDVASAKTHLEAIVARSAPPSVAGDDARVLAQDAYYRLAQLAMREGDPAAAQRLAGRGLELGAREDVFSANLYIVRGRAKEASDQAVEATADYHEALKINDALLRRTLGGEAAEE